MFSVGDAIVYGSTGVCTVLDIGVPDVPGASRKCYMLRPLGDDGAIVYTPVDGGRVSMRLLLTEQEALALINQLPRLKAFAPRKDKRERLEVYRTALKSADSYLLATLVKTLWEERARLTEAKKPMPAAEKECLDNALKIFHGEMAAALRIPMEQIEGYIDAELAQKAQ